MYIHSQLFSFCLFFYFLTPFCFYHCCIVASRKYRLNSCSSYSTPPLTPDKLMPSSPCINSFNFNGFNPSHSPSRSSFSSVGHDENFPPPPSPTCMSKLEHVTKPAGEFQGFIGCRDDGLFRNGCQGIRVARIRRVN